MLERGGGVLFDKKHHDFGFGVNLPYSVENLIDQKWR
jgi:hypothetical protein